MTLKNSLLLAFAGITLTSLAAEAFIVPGPRQPPGTPRHEGPRYPGDDFNQPGDSFPGRDDFGNGSGRQEQKIIYLNRRLANETLELRHLAGITEQYRGYTVESVEVDVRRSGPRAEIALLADGRQEDSAFSPQGRIQLRPRYGAVLGRDFRALQLQVRGNAAIDTVIIHLTENRNDRPDRPGRPGRPGHGDYHQTETVNLGIYRRLYGTDRLDLTQYIDMYRYRGYRIEAIEIDATAVYDSALLDVLVNSFSQGPSLQINRGGYRQVVHLQNAVLGQGADSIVFVTRGDLDIRAVTLRLSRY
ncbi:hypothetical protein [Bdellovibrio reynosensis]|uniref:Uncharacterized protein n=1 Tax=Bdellovibrio reynosensis TaxID=2835041 RepID=A0ABY4C6R5_9BACT|nr:hypothetical protein [Bdellovibrio reynosensis]UOF00605.1 hypothetical protein MNR06_12945 [Bdellovibrio reynosensis]